MLTFIVGVVIGALIGWNTKKPAFVQKIADSLFGKKDS